MAHTETTVNFDALLRMSATERILTAQVLWDSVLESDQIPATTPGQRAEIERRIELADAGKMRSFTWEEVLASLRRRQVTLPLRLLEGARDDVDAGEARYAEQSPGLGDSYLLEVRQTLSRIAAYPESYQIDFGAVRRALVRRFPYAVYYRVLSRDVEVAAILDCRLDPSVVLARLAGFFSNT